MTEQIVEALTSTLDAEYGATYAYGLIGAQVSGADLVRARNALESHRQARDKLRTDLAALSAAIPAPAPAYNTGEPIDDAAAAANLAIDVERRLVPRWAQVAAASGGDSRAQAVRSAQECAVRAVAWGGAPQAFPG